MLGALALLLPLAGCGDDGGRGSDEGGALTVLAAASLTETFDALAVDYDDADVAASYGSSTDLAEQAGYNLASVAFNDPAARHELLRLLHGWIDGSIPRTRTVVTAYDPRGDQ